FAPLLAKILGARRLSQRLILAPVLGALLLWVTDQGLIWLAQVWQEIPTGAATALIGAPLLLWLLPRLHSATAPSMDFGDNVPAERQYLGLWISGGLLILFAGLAVALMFGRDSYSWNWISGGDIQALLHWRWPRVLAALAAGMMLAVAGTLIQKLTGNPMASPEVLGISSGASFGVVIMMFI
ncbi:iron chelate uptake ABC transporter family permease subunit, partial [Yersinia enterocolitica]